MPSTKTEAAAPVVSAERLVSEIAMLAREASIEINVQDEKHLEAGREFLPTGTRIYVSHLPGQQWEATLQACVAARSAGFEPIAHVPVRLLESATALEGLLEGLRNAAALREILLISGDYPQATGPYHAVSQVLATGALERHGFQRVSVAGHPEGHLKVPLEIIRAAECEKVELAHRHGLDATLVTQFLFEPDPVLQWVNSHRARGLKTRYVCGLAGPAKISTLLRYAMRCGVGNSIRALNAHPTSLKNLLGDHGPDRMMRQFAQARLDGTATVDGVHLFCFGGFIRTVQWLTRVRSGDIRLHRDGGFDT